MHLQKKSFIEPVECCPHWLKITLWKKLGHLLQKKDLKMIFPNMLSSASLNFISDMGITDHKHYHQLHGK